MAAESFKLNIAVHFYILGISHLSFCQRNVLKSKNLLGRGFLFFLKRI